MIILACAEIGMKIQERMYKSSELTTEGTAAEIKNELKYEWECCGWINMRNFCILASGCTVRVESVFNTKYEYSSTKNANTMPKNQFTSSLQPKIRSLTLESLNGLSN